MPAITSRETLRSDIIPVVNGVGVEARFTSTVGGREPFVCSAAQADRQWEGPCRRFTIINARSGTLVVVLNWDDQQALVLTLKTLDGLVKGMGCWHSPRTLKLAVETGSVFEVQVTLPLPKTWGSDESQKFELVTTLEP
jgi:hypothetical protein